jgi:hypothetical protein
MKVAGVQPSSCDRFLVPAGVVIVGCVKRLMQVAVEVQKWLRGIGSWPILSRLPSSCLTLRWRKPDSNLYGAFSVK